jgi:hypothetical protein
LVIIVLTVLFGMWLAQGLEAHSPEQQAISDAAAALGGRERIAAVRTLLLEGQGKDFSFGRGARPESVARQDRVDAVCAGSEIARLGCLTGTRLIADARARG